MAESPTGWDALFDALLDDADSVSTTDLRAVSRPGSSGTGRSRVEPLERSLRSEVVRMLSAARAGRDEVSDAEVAEFAEIGEIRARQGVPVEVVLWGWRVGIQLLIDRARELGPAVGADPCCLLDFAQSLLAWTDVALITIAAAHRRAELEVARQEQEHRGDLVRGVLFGTLAPTTGAASSRATVWTPDASTSLSGRGRQERTVERALGFHEALQHRRGLSAVVDGDLVGFLCERPAAGPLGIVGVGPPRTLDRLAESFRLATRALVTADAFGLSGIYDVAQLGLRPAVVADDDVGDALCRRYLDPLTRRAPPAS